MHGSMQICQQHKAREFSLISKHNAEIMSAIKTLPMLYHLFTYKQIYEGGFESNANFSLVAESSLVKSRQTKKKKKKLRKN